MIATSSDLSRKGKNRLLRDATELSLSKFGQGRNWVVVLLKKTDFSGLCGSMFSPFRGPHLNSRKKLKSISAYIIVPNVFR